MFVTANQIYVFLACVSFGGCVGILFSFINGIKFLIKKDLFKIIIDVLAFVIIAILYVIFSYRVKFPSLRLYMIAGVLMGIVIYCKSFHRILAKIVKKAYNIIKIIKNKKVKTKDDGRKDKKTDSCGNGGCSTASTSACFGNALSVNKHKFGKKSAWRT